MGVCEPDRREHLDPALAAYRAGECDPLPTLPPILRAPSAGWNLPEFLYATPQSLLVRGND